MINKRLNLEVGSTTPIVINLINDAGKEEDLTNKISSASFAISKYLDFYEESSILSVTTDTGISVVAGSIQIELNQDQADSLIEGLYPSQLKVVFSDTEKPATTDVFYTKISKGLI